MAPEVPLAHGSQERIARGMHQRIGIRMADETLSVRDLHASQNELASFSQRMDIVTDADFHAVLIRESSSLGMTRQILKPVCLWCRFHGFRKTIHLFCLHY